MKMPQKSLKKLFSNFSEELVYLFFTRFPILDNNILSFPNSLIKKKIIYFSIIKLF